eukprot:3840943-Amphidinium_carterae.1
MAHGEPTGDPQVFLISILSTVRVWFRRILVGHIEWSFDEAFWTNAFRSGRGRGSFEKKLFTKESGTRLGFSVL